MVPTPRIETNKFTCRLPNKGITHKELDVIKLTAQSCFWNGGVKEKVIEDPLFNLFKGLFDAYLGVLKRPENWKEELRKNAADVETVLENCFHCLQWDRSFKERMEKAREKKGRKVARIDEAFAHLVSMREMALCPAKPDPNRPKIDDAVVIRNRGDFERENISGGRFSSKQTGDKRKTGVLKDNKSLAYYNVGAGELLTMSVEWMRWK
ncbi:unnamed protein product [Arabis nemorensis]|uniref:Uncharacterized protein n=1 Tax=Arabis nemorensis TaxID=586526 RepID=A0A565CHJ4_9BRAS|nr:unnamed protein product [Arabis nemorensis]